jgi:LPS sulfotransferase NodH
MSPIFLRHQVTRFVILFVERSGSTYLATLLDAHPDVLARREEFAHLLQKGKGGVEQLAWAREFYSPPLFGDRKALGFKTKLVDILDKPGFAQLLKENGCRVVQLQRRNHVKAAISTLNAKRLHEVSGNWNLLNETDRMPAFPVNLEEFERLLQERLEWDRELEDYVESLKLPSLPLYYEDMLINEDEFIRRVFEFMGVRYLAIKGKTLKNTQDNLRDAIVNFDELRRKYAGTPYEPMFDEVLV